MTQAQIHLNMRFALGEACVKTTPAIPYSFAEQCHKLFS